MFHTDSGDITFFLHIPKTAGTSLRTILEQRFSPEEICPEYHSYNIRQQPDPASYLKRFRFVRGHMNYHIIRQWLDHDPMTLTMLREPTDRLVSHWAFMQEHIPDDTIPHVNRAFTAHVKTRSLEQFIAEVASNQVPTQSTGVGNLQTLMLGGMIQPTTLDGPTINRSPWRDTSALDLECAKQHLQHFAWVGLTERYQDSLALLAYRFGLWPIRTIRHLNVTSRRPQIEQLSPELRDQIMACTQFDQRLYTYAQQMFDERYQTMCLDLLERYGGQEHAHLPFPLTGETLLPLLDRHFANCMRARAQPAMRRSIGLDQPFEGEAWHNIEYTAAGEPYRWTGPECESQLILPLTPGPAYRISFRVVHALSLATLHSLRMTINDTPATLQTVTEPDGATCVTAYIPASALAPEAPFVRIALAVDQTSKPAEGDDRTLGLAFGRVLIEPIEIEPEEVSPPALVSVIIPNYNCAPYLRQAVESVLDQTYPAVEIVVIDDGSTDASVTTIADLVTDDRVRLHQQANAGVAAARNAGIAASHGEYLVFLDCDDYLHPDMIARLMKRIDRDDHRVFAYADYAHVDMVGNILPESKSLAEYRATLEGNLLAPLLIGCYILPLSVLISRQLVLDVGGFDPQYTAGDDYDIWLRVSVRGGIARFVRDTLAYYRHRPGSQGSDIERQYAIERRILRDFTQRYPDDILQVMPQLYEEIRSSGRLAWRESTAHLHRAEAYARSLETLLAEQKQALTTAQTSAHAAESYAQSLETALAQSEAAFRSVEAYALSLEEALRREKAAFAEVEAYAHSLEEHRDSLATSVAPGQVK